MIYRFEAFELDTDQLELRRSGMVQKVEPQVFALLELLISNHTRVVTKDEINQRVWGGRIVSEAAVNSRVRSARKVIDDDRVKIHEQCNALNSTKIRAPNRSLTPHSRHIDRNLAAQIGQSMTPNVRPNTTGVVGKAVK